jgi:hypothetical protein
MEKLPRKGRHQRRPGFYRYRMNENREAVLTVAAEFPWAATNVFYHALPHRSQINLRRDLRHLHSDGFIAHQLPEYGTDLGLPNVHVITERGLDHLASKGIKPRRLVADPELKRVQKGEPRRFRIHTDMHIYTVASLSGGAGDRLRVRREIIGDAPLELPFTITHEGKSKKGILRPDDLFGFKRGDLEEFYFYECENTSVVSRSDLDGSSFFKKALAYHNVLVEKKLHKELLGLRRVRVLVTAPTEERMRHKMAVIDDLFGATDAFLFNVMPYDGKAPSLFTTPWYRVGMPRISLDTGVVTDILK